MSKPLETILKLEVPIIVEIGQRDLPTQSVLDWAPGTIIELSKGAEDELELLVNNKPIGLGIAVKLNENFGIKISYIGDLRSRIEALGAIDADDADMVDDAAAEALADQLLAGG